MLILLFQKNITNINIAKIMKNKIEVKVKDDKTY